MLLLNLLLQIDEDPQKYLLLQSFLPEPPPVRAILGKNIMQAVWEDMKRTLLPSWITPVPHNWGTAKRGKLSADNWLVIFIIHLPITLIRLWGNETGRKHELLANLMHLASASSIVIMHSSREEQILAFGHHIFRYIDGIKKLFPDQRLRPVHHAALHLGDLMDLFGPVHSRSGFFFERYINFFHRINTNQKLGMCSHPSHLRGSKTFFQVKWSQLS